MPARQARLDDEQLDLSPKEFDLLRHLAERAGDVVTKRELLTEVWQQAWGGSEKTVDVHLSWLRRKLGETAADRSTCTRCAASGSGSAHPRAPEVRRRLMLTVAAAVSMVLLAMLVPVAILMRDLAGEDLLARAALEVQATESVVATGSKGSVGIYLERVNDDRGIRTTVLYPDGDAVGPDPGEDRRVLQARSTGLARVDDVDAGTQILVPVSLGASTASSAETPVVRVLVTGPGLDRRLLAGWTVLLVLGLALLAGALVLADRLGRSFTTRWAAWPTTRAASGPPTRATAPGCRPHGARRAARGARARPHPQPPGRAHRHPPRARARHQRRRRPTVCAHPMTALRLRLETAGAAPGDEERARLAEDLDQLQQVVDRIVAEARRSEREGIVAVADARAVVAERVAFWSSLADDEGRTLTFDDRLPGAGAVLVRASADDLAAALDVLLDNVFSHTRPASRRASSSRGLRTTVGRAAVSRSASRTPARGCPTGWMCAPADAPARGRRVWAGDRRTHRRRGGRRAGARPLDLGGALVRLRLGGA